MLEISRDESANGFEGYWAYDISELKITDMLRGINTICPLYGTEALIDSNNNRRAEFLKPHAG